MAANARIDAALTRGRDDSRAGHVWADGDGLPRTRRIAIGDPQAAFATVMAILVPAFDKLKAWAKTNEIVTADDAELAAHPDVQKLYKAEIDRCAPDLADYEKIKRFKLVDKPFTMDGGELTPTLKVKRKFVIQKYADLIASMTR